MILRRIRVFLIWATILLISFLIALYGAVSVPVLALTYYDIYRDFRDYEVSSLDNIPIVLNKDTFNMNVYGATTFKFSYKMDSCPSGIGNKTFLLVNQLINTSNVIIREENLVIARPCSLSYNYVEIERPFYYLTTSQASQIKDLLTGNKDTHLRIATRIYDNYDKSTYTGIRIDFRSLEIMTYFYYEFNTTYYFDHLALDNHITYFTTTNATMKTGGAVPGNANTFLLVSYDSSNYYRIWNTDPTYSTTRPRKTYHVPLGKMITAYGIGIGNYAVAEYDSAFYTVSSSASHEIVNNARIYTLNYSNTQQTFPGATLPTLEYQTCDAWDIPCHLGNAVVYIGKDLPITSDIYSILSKTWQVVSNGMYAISGIFGAVFDSGGLVSGNFFGIALMIAFGIGLTTMIITGGDDDD